MPQPRTRPSGGLQRASPRAGLQLPAAAAELAAISCRAAKACPPLAWAGSACPAETGQAVTRFLLSRKNKEAPRQQMQQPRLCRVSAQLCLAQTTTQDNWKTPPRQLKQQRHGKSGPFPSLPGPPGALPPPKKGKDAKKMRLEYEYDVQTAAAAVTQLELCSHKGPTRAAGGRDNGQPQLTSCPFSPSLHQQPTGEPLPTELSYPPASTAPQWPRPSASPWHSRGCWQSPSEQMPKERE